MLQHVDRVGLQGEPEMAAGADDGDFFSRVLSDFEAHIQVPLMGRVGVAPGEVARLIETFRGRFAALETLIPGQPVARAHVSYSNGAALQDIATAVQPVAEPDDIGRNQRSRVRELVLLEALEAEHHALSLPQLTRALTEAGFDDTSAAIVSQLHRLKKLGVITQPANGMYVLTPDGVLHVRDLRKNFGHLKPR